MPYSRREPSAAVTSTQLADGRSSVRLCAPCPPPVDGSTAAGTTVVARGDLAALRSSGGNMAIDASRGCWSSARVSAAGADGEAGADAASALDEVGAGA